MAGESGGGQAVQGIGSALGAVALYQQASAQRIQDKFAAKQMKRNAKAMMAEAGREASASRKEGDLVKSRATALMAAQGGGVDSSRLAEIEQATDYNVLASLYEGANAMRTENLRANLTMNQSDMNQSNARMGIATKLLDSGQSLSGEWKRAKANRNKPEPYAADMNKFKAYQPFSQYGSK